MKMPYLRFTVSDGNDYLHDSLASAPISFQDGVSNVVQSLSSFGA